MKPETVLIIEDDPELSEVIALNLQRMTPALHVIRAADGRTGLHRALEEDCALVILDITNPSENGLIVYSRLRARRPDLPILTVGSACEESGDIQGLEAADCLIKPFNARELMSRVEELLDRARIERRASGSPPAGSLKA